MDLKKKNTLLASLYISQSWIASWFSLWLLTLETAEILMTLRLNQPGCFLYLLRILQSCPSSQGGENNVGLFKWSITNFHFYFHFTFYWCASDSYFDVVSNNQNKKSFKTSNYVGYVFKLWQFQHPNRTIQKDLPLIHCRNSVQRYMYIY